MAYEYRIYTINQKGEHKYFWKLLHSLPTTKKFMLQATERGLDPVTLEDISATECRYRIKTLKDGKWINSRTVELMADEWAKAMIDFEYEYHDEYCKSYSKSLEDFGEGESITEWICNHGNKTRFILWLYDRGYLN